MLSRLWDGCLRMMRHDWNLEHEIEGFGCEDFCFTFTTSLWLLQWLVYLSSNLEWYEGILLGAHWLRKSNLPHP